MALKTAERSTVSTEIQRLARINQRTRYELSEHQRIIERGARSWQHVRAIVDWMVENCDELPSPAETARICERVPVPGDCPAPACPACRGSGWVYSPIVRNGVQYDGSRLCECRRSK